MFRIAMSSIGIQPEKILEIKCSLNTIVFGQLKELKKIQSMESYSSANAEKLSDDELKKIIKNSCL